MKTFIIAPGAQVYLHVEWTDEAVKKRYQMILQNITDRMTPPPGFCKLSSAMQDQYNKASLRAVEHMQQIAGDLYVKFTRPVMVVGESDIEVQR